MTFAATLQPSVGLWQLWIMSDFKIFKSKWCINSLEYLRWIFCLAPGISRRFKKHQLESFGPRWRRQWRWWGVSSGQTGWLFLMWPWHAVAFRTTLWPCLWPSARVHMFGLFVVTVFMPLLILFALEVFQLKLQARNKLLQTSDEISRRMEERLHQLNYLNSLSVLSWILMISIAKWDLLIVFSAW